MAPVPDALHHQAAGHHEYIVVGAGVLGLSAAWALGRRGRQVLVLDTAAPGNPLSGSKGDARIFRLSYPDAAYVQMAAEALTLWRALESQSGLPLLHLAGLVSIGDDLPAIAAAMDLAGAPCELLSGDEGRRRFPHLRVSGDCLFEATSGVLAADACLRALCAGDTFTVRHGDAVSALHDEGDTVVVALDGGGVLSADVVVNCAGPGALALLPGAVVAAAAPPSLQQVVYLAPRVPVDELPLFIEWGPDMMYGLPVPGRGLLKLSHHTPGSPVTTSLAELPLDDDPRLVELLLQAAARLLPDFSPAPVDTERCVYDNTADTDFIIDRVGRIVIGCGTSGHGFKFGPLLGEALADLATGAALRLEPGRFALNRDGRPAATS